MAGAHSPKSNGLMNSCWFVRRLEAVPPTSTRATMQDGFSIRPALDGLKIRPTEDGLKIRLTEPYRGEIQHATRPATCGARQHERSRSSGLVRHSLAGRRGCGAKGCGRSRTTHATAFAGHARWRPHRQHL